MADFRRFYTSGGGILGEPVPRKDLRLCPPYYSGCWEGPKGWVGCHPTGMRPASPRRDSRAGETTMAKDKGPPSYRDAGDGKFVTPGYAKAHPGTTEKEHNNPPPKKGK